MSTDVAAENPFAGQRRSNRLRTILLISLGIIAVLAVIIFYTHSHRSTIIIGGPTTGFTITINGNAVRTEKTSRGLEVPVYSGVYRIKIDRPSYASFTADVTVPPGTDVLVRPSFVLLPASSETAQQGIAYVRPSPDQRSLYYLGAGRSHLFRLEIGNQVPIQLTDNPLEAVSDVQWSNNPNVAIIQQPDSTSLYEIPKFDFQTQKVVQIGGSEIISPVWDPVTSNRIAAAYFTAAGEHTLVIADKKFTAIDRKADLTGLTDPKLVWSPDGRYILVINRSAKASDNNMWLYSLEKASLQQITTDGSILNASFNSTSSLIAFEQFKDGGDRQILTYAVDGGAITDLKLHTTLSLTTWKDTSHLYAVAPATNELVAVGLDGSEQAQSLSFPQDTQGLYYFSPSHTLIYYTENTVYTVGLDS